VYSDTLLEIAVLYSSATVSKAWREGETSVSTRSYTWRISPGQTYATSPVYTTQRTLTLTRTHTHTRWRHTHTQIDHLIPVSRGGPWTWENLVTACNVCNTKKGSKTPEQAGLKLRSKPFRPSGFRLQLRRSELRSPPAIWEPYLPQDKPRSDLML